MNSEPKPPITVRFVNGHNNLIDCMVANYRKRVSADFVNKLFDEWERLQKAIEHFCQTNNIDPDQLQIYSNTVGMVEKMTAQFTDLGKCKSFDMRMSVSQMRAISALKLNSFRQRSGTPSAYFLKFNPNEQKPVGFL
jgi:hypothetical protein